MIRWCLVAVMAVVIPLLTAPFASAAPWSASAPAKSCEDTAIQGTLGLGINKQVNAGGPNFVSGVCKDMNMQVRATRITHTRTGGLEPSDGAGLDCGRWVLLEFDRWQILRPDVQGGTRWQIQMYADSADTIDFDYTA